MLTPVPSSALSSYDGELKNSGDEREAQILYEFDCGFQLLLNCGVENGLQLPPLFDKSYIDHGSVTGVFPDMLTRLMLVILL